VVSESGSSLAGAKAGILGGIFFAAAAGLFNEVLLQTFSGSVLQVLSTNPLCSGATASASAQDCFSTLLTADIPSLVIFPIAVFGIIFGGLYGVYYEFLPGRGYRIRAVAMGMGMLIMILFFGVAGLTTDQTQKALMDAFDSVTMLVYAVIIAHYYRKYTREVEFDSPDPDKLKITVDGKNFTGKVKTLSIHSTHTVRAPSESGAFKEWLVSGGVSVLDAKSFETTMRVDGDGLLKISRGSNTSAWNKRVEVNDRQEKPSVSSQIVVKEKEIHVVVRVPCKFCGVLNDQLRTKCESCGAALK
jgi:hypothetical protein